MIILQMKKELLRACFKYLQVHEVKILTGT